MKCIKRRLKIGITNKSVDACCNAIWCTPMWPENYLQVPLLASISSVTTTSWQRVGKGAVKNVGKTEQDHTIMRAWQRWKEKIATRRYRAKRAYFNFFFLDVHRTVQDVKQHWRFNNVAVLLLWWLCQNIVCWIAETKVSNAKHDRSMKQWRVGCTFESSSNNACQWLYHSVQQHSTMKKFNMLIKICGTRQKAKNTSHLPKKNKKENKNNIKERKVSDLSEVSHWHFTHCLECWQ